MHSEIPILTANVSSLPEVAQDAALYCNPYDIANISNKIKQLYSDDLLRKQLVSKGNLRRENFSWDNTANALWKSCEKVLHKN
jgi:glycosyltransferase involved in cell wall biosynthesis